MAVAAEHWMGFVRLAVFVSLAGLLIYGLGYANDVAIVVGLVGCFITVPFVLGPSSRLKNSNSYDAGSGDSGGWFGGGDCGDGGD